jgi:hypothetical protein
VPVAGLLSGDMVPVGTGLVMLPPAGMVLPPGIVLGTVLGRVVGTVLGTEVGVVLGIGVWALLVRLANRPVDTIAAPKVTAIAEGRPEVNDFWKIDLDMGKNLIKRMSTDNHLRLLIKFCVPNL